MRNVFVVGEELFGVFGEAVAAVAEGGIVVVGADAGVEGDAVDDVFGVQTFGLGVGVELVEVGDAEGEVGVGEEFDGFGFGAIHEEDGGVFFLAGFEEEIGEGFGGFGFGADDDAGGVEVVVEGFAFAEEFRGEEDVFDAVFVADGFDVADGDGGLDDHGDGFVAIFEGFFDDVFDGGGVEEVAFVVVVGWGGDDDEFGALQGFFIVDGGG